jgi:hypothetical protein
MSQVDDRDSDHLVSLGIIVRGKYRDIQRVRDLILQSAKDTTLMRVIYGTISGDLLYIVKDEDWRRLKDLESTGGDKKIG